MVRVASRQFVGLLCLVFLVSCSALPKSNQETESIEPDLSSSQQFLASDLFADSHIPDGSGPITGKGIEPVDSLFFGPLVPELTGLSIETARVTNDPATMPAGNSHIGPGEIQYDVPIIMNDKVKAYIEYFNTEIRDRFQVWLERSGRYLPFMRRTFREHGIPEDLVYVALIESGFNPRAYSRARAVGPWQFMKATGRLYKLRINTWVDERRDPVKSTRAAARHLRDLHEHFGTWPLAMAAYNAGTGKISRALAKAKTDNYWDLLSTRHIRRETKGYVPKFMAATVIAKDPVRFGYDLDYHEPVPYDTVTVKGSSDLRVIAKAAGISYKTLKALNPELRTILTPVYLKKYPLRLPSGKKQSFLEAYAKIPDSKKAIGTRYKVRRNDTLSEIAARFGTTVSMLRGINNIPRRHLLQIGRTLYIPKHTRKPKSRQNRVVKKQLPKSTQLGAFRSALGPSGLGSANGKVIYLVKPGDTLWDISQSFDVSIRDIKRYNGLRRNTIQPGDHLILGVISKDL